MILVTVTHRNGVELVHELTLAIDPEKIVSVKDSGIYAVIEYGECYSRNWSPVLYQLDTDRATIDALILGDYTGKQYLALTVYDLATGDTFAMDLQEKYIVDIRDGYYAIAGTKTACRKLLYVPGSFAPVIIYVSNALNTLVTDTPAEVTTTTTTAAATTTTTTAAATTTTTTAAATTTTTTQEQGPG